MNIEETLQDLEMQAAATEQPVDAAAKCKCGGTMKAKGSKMVCDKCKHTIDAK